MRAGRALLAPLAAIAFLSVLAAPASASIQFDQQWGSLGILNGQFSLPNRVATDSSGSVYATDTGNSRVEKFSSLGAFIAKWGAVGTGDGQFLSEQGIATDTAGNVYVVDGQANRIQKFNSSGTFTTKWGSLGAGNGQFTGPQGIATDSSDNVYVTDQDNDRIQKFDSSGAFITKWGSLGTGNGQFSAPAGVATDSSGNVYVADAGNTRIQKFSSSGNFITKWGSLGAGDDQFGASTTLDVATGSAGNVLVADSSNNRIEKFRPSGTFITKWGSLGTGAGQFTSPTGVATDPSDNVYVLDQGNSRIEKFDETDATAPDTAIDSGPSGVSNADVSFTFSSPEPQLLGFECRLDSSDFASCASPKAYSNLPEGSHTFEVRAVDSAGNPDPSPASRTWTVDRTAPETQIDSGPSGPTNDASPSFGFSSEAGASFECRLDSSQEADFQPCGSPKSYGPLPDGSHTFEVRATDSLGNTDPTPAMRSFTVDASAPDTQIDSGPSGPTNDATPSFGFSSEGGASFECRLDSSQEADFQPCGSPKSYGPLPDGSHTFEVRATDSLGNTDPTPASRGFTVDTSAPQTQINSGPSGLTKDATPSFGFSSGPGASFECELDGGAYVACGSPKTYSTLPNGHHTFRVRATDAASNTDPTPASRSFTVDTVPPNTAIITGPSGGPSPHATVDPTPTFTFSSSQAGSSFACKFGSSPYAACPSPWTAAHLADGAYRLYVRATDPAGNVDPTPTSLGFSVQTASVKLVGSKLVIVAASGADDNLAITAPSASILRVTDLAGGPYRGSGVHTGAGCTRTGDNIANCNATGIRLITVNAGDLADRVINSTDITSSLVGGGGPDVLSGGSRNDNLSGLAGADVMRGMNGNDRLFAHDGSSDKTIDCDGGTAPGATDQADLDAIPKDPDSRVIGCETVTRH